MADVIKEDHFPLQLGELIDLSKYVKTEIARLEREKQCEDAHRAVKEILKREYNNRAPDGSPKFDDSLVVSKPRPSDGGYKGSYDNGKNVELYVKAYVTWRLGDHDMFTDVWGSVNNVQFIKKGN